MDKEHKITLGRVVRALRTVRGISQEEMHKHVKMSSAYISLIESDRREPSIKKLKNLAKFFGISTNALLFLGSSVPEELVADDRKKYLDLQKKFINETLEKYESGEMPWQLQVLNYLSH